MADPINAITPSQSAFQNTQPQPPSPTPQPLQLQGQTIPITEQNQVIVNKDTLIVSGFKPDSAGRIVGYDSLGNAVIEAQRFNGETGTMALKPNEYTIVSGTSQFREQFISAQQQQGEKAVTSVQENYKQFAPVIGYVDPNTQQSVLLRQPLSQAQWKEQQEKQQYYSDVKQQYETAVHGTTQNMGFIEVSTRPMLDEKMTANTYIIPTTKPASYSEQEFRDLGGKDLLFQPGKAELGDSTFIKRDYEGTVRYEQYQVPTGYAEVELGRFVSENAIIALIGAGAIKLAEPVTKPQIVGKSEQLLNENEPYILGGRPSQFGRDITVTGEVKPPQTRIGQILGNEPKNQPFTYQELGTSRVISSDENIPVQIAESGSSTLKVGGKTYQIENAEVIHKLTTEQTGEAQRSFWGSEQPEDITASNQNLYRTMTGKSPEGMAEDTYVGNVMSRNTEGIDSAYSVNMKVRTYQPESEGFSALETAPGKGSSPIYDTSDVKLEIANTRQAPQELVDTTAKSFSPRLSNMISDSFEAPPSSITYGFSGNAGQNEINQALDNQQINPTLPPIQTQDLTPHTEVPIIPVTGVITNVITDNKQDYNQNVITNVITSQQQDQREIQRQIQIPMQDQITQQQSDFVPITPSAPTIPMTPSPSIPFIPLPPLPKLGGSFTPTTMSGPSLPKARFKMPKLRKWKKQTISDPLARSITRSYGITPSEPKLTRELQEKAFVGVPTRELQKKPTFTYGRKFT